MTISNVTEKTQYTSTGQTTFAYTFKILADADILVVTTNLTTGVDTTHNLTTDYTVTGAGNDSGGNVVFNTATTSGHRVTLTRSMALTQTTDLVTQGGFSADVLETSLDRLTMFAQQLAYSINKGLETPTSDTSTIGDLPTQTARASKFLAFDSSGNPIAAATVTGSAASTWGEAWIQKTTGQAAADVLTNTDSFSFKFGADGDVTLTHVHDTGLKLNSTLHLEKSDATAYSATAGDGQVTVGPTIYLENPANANDTVGGQVVFGMRSTEVQARIGATGGTSPALVFGTADAERMRINSAGTVSLTDDLSVGDDLSLASDAAVINMGADSDVTLTHVHNTGVELSAGANLTQFTIKSTDSGASVGPYINLDRLGADAEDNDGLGIIQWRGQNDAGTPETIAYAQIYPVITDATDGSETNHLQFNIYNGGAAETPVYINYAGKVYIYNNDATNVGLRVRQDNASNTNYGIISQTDGTGTAGYFSTAGAGTALYGYCGGALYGVRGYSVGHYAGYFSGGNRGLYAGGTGKKYLIGSYSATYGSYSNGSYYSATNTYTGSDARLKDVTSQITTSDGILAKINSLKPIMYTWKENTDGYVKDANPECGFLAQEVKEVFPDLISEAEVPDMSAEEIDNGRDTKTLNEELGQTFGMSYEKLSVYLAAALQEASKKIDALEARIKTLEDA